jgi:hypothetical protein
MGTAQRRSTQGFFAAAVVCAGICCAESVAPPVRWFVSGGDAPGMYSGILDHTVAYDGAGSGLLSATDPSAHHGTLMQVAAADSFRGKRIKLKAFLRSRDVVQRAGLWIRTDDVSGRVLTFRNCFSPTARQSFVRGDTDWREAEVSLDVPESAAVLAFGVQILGTGAVWIDNVSFEIIGTSEPNIPLYSPVRITRPLDPANPPSQPLNLDFEH